MQLVQIAHLGYEHHTGKWFRVGYEFIALRLLRKMDERRSTMQVSRVFRVIAWYFEKFGHLTEPT